MKTIMTLLCITGLMFGTVADASACKYGGTKGHCKKKETCWRTNGSGQKFRIC